ncbi:MAG: hypothetical protein AB7K86_09320 [Rhodospirillales bacterium]
MRLTLFIAAAACAAITGGATAGELTGGVWRSTQCVKPTPPAAVRTDAETLNETIIRYNAYIGDIRTYDDCLRAELDRDMQTMRAGYQAAQSAALREAEAARPRGTEAR